MARFVVTVPIDANSVDQDVFIAPFPCFVSQIQGTKSTAGGSGAEVVVRKCTGTTAPASGTALHATAIDLTTGVAVNTVISPTLTANEQHRRLAVGDRLAIDMGGTLTALVGSVAIELVDGRPV